MLVGIICECSGEVRDAFIRRGHDAVSCDLKPTRKPGPHLQGDCFSFDWEGFDLLIMHPDCTYLTVSGLHWNARTPGRAQKTEEAIDFVARLWALPVKMKALENRVGCLSTRWRKPDQIIQPYEFGADASKKTCLWLENLPLLKPTLYIPPKYACKCGCRFDLELGKYGCPNCEGDEGGAKQVWGNQTPSGQNKLGPSPERKELRSNTYTGIAEAMADQWGSLPV